MCGRNGVENFSQVLRRFTCPCVVVLKPMNHQYHKPMNHQYQQQVIRFEFPHWSVQTHTHTHNRSQCLLKTQWQTTNRPTLCLCVCLRHNATEHNETIRAYDMQCTHKHTHTHTHKTAPDDAAALNQESITPASPTHRQAHGWPQLSAPLRTDAYLYTTMQPVTSHTIPTSKVPSLYICKSAIHFCRKESSVILYERSRFSTTSKTQEQSLILMMTIAIWFGNGYWGMWSYSARNLLNVYIHYHLKESWCKNKKRKKIPVKFSKFVYYFF